MTRQCVHLVEFLRVERGIIQKHIDQHKWCRKIPDYNEGVADFIDEFGWLMREMYCGHVCEHRCDCEIAQQILKEREERDGREEAEAC